ncbi:MAG: hypothetical protein GX113_11315 [Actinobacteria bacterium]|jgi:predicted MPP superfamily phosphohydrolase|nr:hypothetical protein [Actinomycetota bacterium]
MRGGDYSRLQGVSGATRAAGIAAVARTGEGRRRPAAARVAGGLVAAGGLAAAYMVFEAQWVKRRQVDLPVPGLPEMWSGLTVLHLADVHAGAFLTNERSLRKVVRWAEPLAPDLVFLTGDILGDPAKSGACLDLLAQIRPSLGMFAVTGNHEHGLSKAPLARPVGTSGLWSAAGITLLSDSCVALPPRHGTQVIVCGADYLTGGYGLLADGSPAGAVAKTAGDSPPSAGRAGVAFPILLIHDPPPADAELASIFPLAFAGHTHGGQLRVPAPSGLTPLNRQHNKFLDGVHRWGAGLLVVTRGVGTSFLPFRLFTRPEATLWRLVYTSPEHSDQRMNAPEEENAHGRIPG